MKHDFEQRRQRRIENAQKQAIKNEKEAESLYNQASEISKAIPFGQPILIGHHSEKSDRNYRQKIHNKFGKSFEKMDKARYYEEKAQIIENNTAIYSDDPEAINKLQEKLKSLEHSQAFMKAANKFIKQKSKEGFLALPHATEEIWQKINTPDVMGKIGFASYSLRNNNANIKRIKDRIRQLQKQREGKPFNEVINGVRIFENREANRLQLFFETTPSFEVRKKLKKCGFRWSSSEGAWQRYISASAIYFAKTFAKDLDN
ncbi:DUF3560 domain-containing protein [Olivibacter jilunii]|uniref:DUF3560 domain-containing protein n=1 Tax=Olivibacter jilunii TaxID=985016 RepID=UPI00102F92DD|nr:DUF3560 domain-containing protein [Olivibacter jilunii]